MDVFLSWSSERSRLLANIFNEWVSNVLPTVKTYISTEQIGPGDRWSENIGKGLESNFMGIFFMVEENVSSPWLNFEAGAISKNIEDSKVIPLLHKMKPEQINGPMAQFQAKLIDQEEDIFSIVKQINAGITDERKISIDKLRKLFDKWYPDFDEVYKKFIEDNPTPESLSENKTSLLNSEDQIGEILNIVRDFKRSGIIQNNYPSSNFDIEDRSKKNEMVLKYNIRKQLNSYDENTIIDLINSKNLDNTIIREMLVYFNEFPQEIVISIINKELKRILHTKYINNKLDE